MLVAIAHPLMRELTLELARSRPRLLAYHRIRRQRSRKRHPVDGLPDLVVLDTASLDECPCGCADNRFPCHRMVVIGPEPDGAYRSAALHVGAGGWVARDVVAEQLSNAMRAALGCTHGPCPDAVPDGVVSS